MEASKRTLRDIQNSQDTLRRHAREDLNAIHLRVQHLWAMAADLAVTGEDYDPVATGNELKRLADCIHKSRMNLEALIG